MIRFKNNKLINWIMNNKGEFFILFGAIFIIVLTSAGLLHY